MRCFRKIFWVFAIACIAVNALAQQGVTEGAYGVIGGSYRIQVKQGQEGLLVVEPNKVSPYTRQADGSYHFHNPKNDTTYGLRVVNADTIEAFKPFTAGSGVTQLKLIAATVAPGTLGDDAIAVIARKYESLAKTDPGNAHVWSSCAAAAQSRSVSNDGEFDEYVGLVVQMLKPIMVNAATTPCPDAIPASVW